MKSDTAVRRKMGYAEVAESLRKMIEAGTIREGSFLPTERELTDKFDVSRTTIRRGLQNLVDMGWAEPSPNRGVIARSGPRHIKTTNVAFIDHVQTVNRHLFLALSQEMQNHGYHLVHVDSANKGVEGAIKYAAENEFAAAFVWPKKGYLDLEHLADSTAHCPIINLQHRFPNLETDLVTEDHFQGGWLAAQQLAKHGRSRIAVTGMLDMLETNHKRFSGYMMGCFNAGVQPFVNNYVFSYTSNMNEPDTSLLAHRLQQADRPDALFIMDDYLVPQVVQTIQDAGLRIPEDVALVAFGNDVPAHFGDAALTTISMDWDRVARSAAELFVKRQQGWTDPPTTISLPVHLIVRGSCGAPQEEWLDHPFFQHVNSLKHAPASLNAYGQNHHQNGLSSINPFKGKKQ